MGKARGKVPKGTLCSVPQDRGLFGRVTAGTVTQKTPLESQGYQAERQRVGRALQRMVGGAEQEFIYSFTHSFIHSHTPSFILSFIHSFIHLLIH